MKLYLAGPMSGIKDNNRQLFCRVADWLTACGHTVCNPAVEGEQDEYRAAMKYDLNWILDHAEGIAFLPGWENSKGAKAEWALGVCLDLPMFYLTPAMCARGIAEIVPLMRD